MSLLFDLADRDLKKKIDRLEPVPGYCILIDMVGSTALKDDAPRMWLSRIHDTFALAKSYLNEFQPLKTIGDALMFYISDSELSAKQKRPLTLHLALCFLVQEELTHVFGKTKVAVTRCLEAYQVTFTRGCADIYGKDIDLTARLLSVALECEILMNESFVEEVRADYQSASVPADFPDVSKIEGPWAHRFKGFADNVNVYKSPAGGTSLAKHLPSSYQGLS